MNQVNNNVISNVHGEFSGLYNKYNRNSNKIYSGGHDICCINNIIIGDTVILPRELGPEKPRVPVTYMEQTHQTNTVIELWGVDHLELSSQRLEDNENLVI